MLAEVETRQNGSAAAVPMRVKIITFDLDAIGYEGWWVTMRTNPRSSTYDSLLALDEEGRWWKAFGEIVQRWNFADEDGKPFPLPRDCETEHDLDLPHGVIAYIFKRYLEAFRVATELPKEQPEPSAPTSSTSEGSPLSE